MRNTYLVQRLIRKPPPAPAVDPNAKADEERQEAEHKVRMENIAAHTRMCEWEISQEGKLFRLASAAFHRVSAEDALRDAGLLLAGLEVQARMARGGGPR